MKLSDRLFQEGVFAQGIASRPSPRTRPGRTIVTATHTREDLHALDTFGKVGKELGLV